MLGFVLNSHQQWLCRQLTDAGYTTARQVSVPDNGTAIRDAVREALSRADFIIVTGGLGPTSDDITRDLIADLLGRKLYRDAAEVAHLKAFFEERKRVMPESVTVQAMVPEGAMVLHNYHGTAPGLALEVSPNPFQAPGEGGAAKSWLVMLPGPTREMRPMFLNQVLPVLKKEFPLPGEFVCRTLRTTGIGESLIEDKIRQPLADVVSRGLELGYCAHYEGVDVRLIGHGDSAVSLVTEAEGIVKALLGENIFGEQEETLPSVMVRWLKERGETLSVAESCTGGHLANRITDVPGASAVFMGGFVTYSNESKQLLLGVNPGTLAQYGAVSKETAGEMAEGARNRMGSTRAIAITGIAGPDGGTPEKPVGTVFIALASPNETVVVKMVNSYERTTFKLITSQQALFMLRKKML